MTGTALHTNEILQYLALDEIVICINYKNTLFSLCYFNLEFCNKYAYYVMCCLTFLFQYNYIPTEQRNYEILILLQIYKYDQKLTCM